MCLVLIGKYNGKNVYRCFYPTLPLHTGSHTHQNVSHHISSQDIMEDMILHKNHRVRKYVIPGLHKRSCTYEQISVKN